MKSTQVMLDWAISRQHKVKYSMAYPARLGPGHLDCSSFVYYALIAGGFLPKSTTIGNTETLYQLKGTIFNEIYSYDEIIPGDIFIRGRQGKSLGAAGHTGIFTKKGEIIHCNATYDTVTINNERNFIRYFLDCERSERERYFRPTVGDRRDYKYQNKVGKARVRYATNVRTTPSPKSAKVAIYYPGQVIYYDRLLEANGYKWLSYVGRTSGLRRYVAYSDYNKTWIDI